MRKTTLPAVVALIVLTAGTGCNHTLSPLYRDYDVPPGEGDVYERIRTALAEAGWEEAEPSARNVVTTKPRDVRNWGLYEVRVWLDVAPVNDRYVRVLFHPYRYYITGTRGKIAYLNRSLRNAFLDDLNAAFSDQGLVAVGTPVERDRETTRQ